MSSCALAPSLSAYVDGELAVPRRHELEQHLAECPECRHEIAALREMVRRLHALAPAAPPPSLSIAVAERIASQPLVVGRIERWEAWLRRFTLPTTMIPLTAWVVALAIMGLFLIRVMSPEVGTPVPSVDVVSQQAVLAVLGGRVFERRSDRWCEEGTCDLDLLSSPHILSTVSSEAIALRDSLPGISMLLDSGLPLVLWYEGSLVTLEPRDSEVGQPASPRLEPR